MFERFCGLLLRIYPSEFRRSYGDEAAQLIRDRVRDERGVMKRARLLMDLSADLFAISLRGWHSARPLLANVDLRDGTPHFDIIEVSGPRPEALAVGLVTSTLMFAGFTLLFQPRAFPPAPAQLGAPSGSPQAAGESSDSEQQTVAAEPNARHPLIATIAANLKQRYFDRAIGEQLAEGLLAHDRNGAYNGLTGTELASGVNTDIRETSRALGVAEGTFVADVVYSEQRLPEGPPPPQTTEMRARYREGMQRQNCLFETVEMLPHDIGYLKLNGFPDATVCHDTADRAMRSVNSADALIVDLRDNVGGFGDIALQIAAYFFNRPTFLYDPRPQSQVPAETSSPIPGNTLVDKPVYILTSSTTQSAAEYFVYNLKMLKRATVVGETTAGRQHSGVFHRIQDHFGIGIQETAPPDNPFPVKGWELIGVEPDVKVSSKEAFDAARQLAESKVRGRIRALNSSRSRQRQIRVLLGDPPIEWDEIHTKDDIKRWMSNPQSDRDGFPADLIRREVRAKNRRALIVYGAMHLQRRNLFSNYDISAGLSPTIVHELESSGDTKVFTIWRNAHLDKLQPDVASWPRPSLVLVRGTHLGAADFTFYHPSKVRRVQLKDGKVVPVPEDEWKSLRMEDQADAVLYPEPASIIQRAELPRSLCRDTDYLKKRLARIALVGFPPQAERLREMCGME